MCMQCVAGAAAVSTGAGVTGMRAWLGTRDWSWLTPRRLRRVTIALLATTVVAVGAAGGSPPTPAPGAGVSSVH